jgi:hypothetical protein
MVRTDASQASFVPKLRDTDNLLLKRNFLEDSAQFHWLDRGRSGPTRCTLALSDAQKHTPHS